VVDLRDPFGARQVSIQTRESGLAADRATADRLAPPLVDARRIARLAMDLAQHMVEHRRQYVQIDRLDQRCRRAQGHRVAQLLQPARAEHDDWYGREPWLLLALAQEL